MDYLQWVWYQNIKNARENGPPDEKVSRQQFNETTWPNVEWCLENGSNALLSAVDAQQHFDKGN